MPHFSKKNILALLALASIIASVAAGPHNKGYRLVRQPDSDSGFQLADAFIRGQMEDLSKADLLGAKCSSECPGWRLFEVTYLRKISPEIVTIQAQLELASNKVTVVKEIGELPKSCPPAPLPKLVSFPSLTSELPPVVAPSPVVLNPITAGCIAASKAETAIAEPAPLQLQPKKETKMFQPQVVIQQAPVAPAPLIISDPAPITDMQPAHLSVVKDVVPTVASGVQEGQIKKSCTPKQPVVLQAEPVAATVKQYFSNPSFVLSDKLVRSQYPYELTKGEVTAAQIKLLRDPTGVLFHILYHSWMGRFEATVVISDGLATLQSFSPLSGNPLLDTLCKTWDNGSCKECAYRAYFNKNGKCIEVSNLCDTFDSTTGDCQSCYKGYSLRDGKCFLGAQASELPPNCSTLDDKKRCVACFYRYYLDQEGSCKEVSPLCQTWNNKGQCLNCYRGYVLRDGACRMSK